MYMYVYIYVHVCTIMHIPVTPCITSHSFSSMLSFDLTSSSLAGSPSVGATSPIGEHCTLT